MNARPEGTVDRNHFIRGCFTHPGHRLEGNLLTAHQITDTVDDTLDGLSCQIGAGAPANQILAPWARIQDDVANAFYHTAAFNGYPGTVFQFSTRDRRIIHRKRGVVPQVGAAGELITPVYALGTHTGVERDVAVPLQE